MLNKQKNTVGLDVVLSIFNDLSTFQSLSENFFGGEPVSIIGIEVH
jgi:hypothetical protein